MKTGHKGNISEILALAELLAAGKEVAIPYGNCPGYDLLVLGQSGLWLRVQVKTAYQRGGRGGTYVDFLRGSGKGKRRFYTEADLDYLIGVRQDTKDFWVFPVAAVVGKRCVTVTQQDAAFRNVACL